MSTETIIEHLPRKLTGNNHFVKEFPVTVMQPASSNVEDVVHRANIIHTLAKNCTYQVGDVVRPVSDAVWRKDGPAKVIGIAHTIAEWAGTEKDKPWPKDDNPMIVEAVYIESNTTVHATTNYFFKLNPIIAGNYKS